MARILTTAYLALAVMATTATAQVNGPGPSDPNDFDTVINLPEDQASISGSVGNADRSATPTTQLNLVDGGSVGNNFNAFSGSEVNISGGLVGDRFDASRGSEVNISGGSIGAFFESDLLSNVSISGGSFGPGFSASSGSDVEFVGGEFELDGVAYTDSTITLLGSGIFTGTLADGSSFILFSPITDNLYDVTLTAAPLPPLETTPQVVNTNISATGPSGLRAGEVLTLQSGGVLGNAFAVVSATLNIQGGVVGNWLETTNSTVNISGGSVGEAMIVEMGTIVNVSGGSVGDLFFAKSGSLISISGGSVGNDFQARFGSTVNISGGNVGNDFVADSGSMVSISGGAVGRSFYADIGSVVNISGGSVGEDFYASATSVINISGGSVGERFDASSLSEINLFGTEFLLDGLPLNSLVQDEPFIITDRGGKTLSGTLTDGSVFEFVLNDSFPSEGDFFDADALLTVTLVTPGNFDLDTDVDGSDFLQWQRNTDNGNLGDWQTNYGTGANGSSAAAAVPEPSTTLLALSALLTVAERRRRQAIHSADG